MRILSIGNMYPPHHLGGYELAWRAAIHYLRDRGHTVRVLTTDHRNPERDPALADDDDVHRTLRWYWRDHSFPRLGGVERLLIESHNRRELLYHLRELRPEVVNWWAMGGMSLSMIELARRRGLPAAGVVGDDWMDYGPRVDAWQRAVGRRPLMRRPLEWITRVPGRVELGQAAIWVFVSDNARRRALAAGWRLPRTRIQPNGVDPAVFPAAAERDWQWRLLYVGRVDPRKGVQTAIEALGELPQARLAVVGDGDRQYLARLRERAAELRVDSRVEFRRVGHDRVAAEYAAADVVLFPSVWEEPFGLVPLEAMSVGRPVVATGTGGSGEFLQHEENCLLFAPRDDPRALAAAVNRLAADGALRDRLRDRGFETAGRFTEEAFNSGVEEALEEAVRTAHPQALP